MPARQVFSAIVYVLRTGCQWRALPKEFGSASAVHKHFQEWQKAGFFLRLWQAGLAEYDGMQGIAWEWQSIDGATGKAPLASECVGPNPTDRGKKWPQTKFIGGRPWRPAVARRQRGQRGGPGSAAGDSGSSGGQEAQTAQESAAKPMRGRRI